MTRLRKFILFCIVALLAPKYQAISSYSRLNGDWAIIRIAPGGPIVGMSDETATKLKGRILSVRDDVITFDSVSCRKPRFSARLEHNPQQFFQDYYKSLIPLDLSNIQVRIVEIECDDKSSFAPLFLKDARRLVFNWKGFFLEATKVSLSPAK
jgi:hypothetical protein